MQPFDVFGLSPLGNFIINFVVNWLGILGKSIMYILYYLDFGPLESWKPNPPCCVFYETIL